MGIRSSFFLFLFGITCCIFSQQEFSISPFSSPINWPKIAHKTNVGIYIKGNDSKVQKIVQDYQANYIQKHQDWHYIRIAPSLCKNLILEKDLPFFCVCDCPYFGVYDCPFFCVYWVFPKFAPHFRGANFGNTAQIFFFNQSIYAFVSEICTSLLGPLSTGVHPQEDV